MQVELNPQNQVGFHFIVPKEIIPLIFQCLQPIDEINNFSYVCKQWYVIKLQDSLKKEQLLINCYFKIFPITTELLKGDISPNSPASELQTIVVTCHQTMMQKQKEIDGLNEANPRIFLDNIRNSYKETRIALNFFLESINKVLDQLPTTNSREYYSLLKETIPFNSSEKLEADDLALITKVVVGNYGQQLIKSIFQNFQAQHPPLGAIENNSVTPDFGNDASWGDSLWEILEERINSSVATNKELNRNLLEFHLYLKLEKIPALEKRAKEKLLTLARSTALGARQLLRLFRRDLLPLDVCIRGSKAGLFSVRQRRNFALKSILNGEDKSLVLCLLQTIPEDSDKTYSKTLRQLIDKLSELDGHAESKNWLASLIPNKNL